MGVDGGDDVLEQTRLLVDSPLRCCFPTKQPASTENGECEDRYQPAPAGLSGGSFHVEHLPRNARSSAGCIPLIVGNAMLDIGTTWAAKRGPPVLLNGCSGSPDPP